MTVTEDKIGVNYAEYILSDEWKARREAALSRAGNRCQLCGAKKHLHVHHNTYENLGHERDEDLIVLCQPCHDVYHASRDSRTKRNERYRETPKVRPVIPTPDNPKPERPFVEIPKRTKNGIKRKIVVTPEYVESLISSDKCAAITAKGIRLLGGSWPPKSGWRYAFIGREVEVDEGELAAELERAKAGRCGLRVRKPRPHNRELTVEDKDKAFALFARGFKHRGVANALIVSKHTAKKLFREWQNRPR
jgi:hypothetical protein